MDRTQFTFYDSFFDAAQEIRDPAQRCAFYDAVCNYALHEVAPDREAMDDAAAMGFKLVKPILDASRKKAKSGKAGGSAKQTEANDKQTEANPKQGEAEARENPKQVKEQEKEQEKEKEQMLNNPLAPFLPDEREAMIEDALVFHGKELVQAVKTWTQYKLERREPYKRTGYRSLLTQIEKHAREYGDQAMIEVINESMSSGYKGIMFDRLKNRKPQQTGRQDYSTVGKWLNGA